jgi:hypothetical protein
VLSSSTGFSSLFCKNVVGHLNYIARISKSTIENGRSKIAILYPPSSILSHYFAVSHSPTFAVCLRTQRAGSPFSVIKPKLVGVASNLDAIAVRIEKADGAVTGDFQDFRPAHDGNFPPLEHGIKIIDVFVCAYVNTEMMQLGYPLPARVLGASWKLHQSNVMVLSAEAHKGHLRAPVPSGDLHTDDRAIEVLRFFSSSPR